MIFPGLLTSLEDIFGHFRSICTYYFNFSDFCFCGGLRDFVTKSLLCIFMLIFEDRTFEIAVSGCLKPYCDVGHDVWFCQTLISETETVQLSFSMY